MKIVIEFARSVFYSSEKSGNLATKIKKKTIKKTTLDPRPSTKTYLPGATFGGKKEVSLKASKK